MDVFLDNQINQSQQLHMTPKIMEELQILQMSAIELEQYIEDAMVDNPLLEEEEHGDEVENFIELNANDCESDDYDDINPQSKPEFSAYFKSGILLKEYLMMQLKELKLEPQIRKAAAYIIESIDEQGYFKLSIKRSAGIIRVSEIDMKAGLKCVQNMEPSGIGARNLEECLLIQLRDKEIDNSLIRSIIMNHLAAISERKYTLISKTLGVSIEEVIGIHNIIRTLSPKPGVGFSAGKIEYIKPELEVRNINSEFSVMFLNDNSPSLRINRSYISLLKSEPVSSDITSYIKARLSKALDIVRAIEKRRKTILDITDFIVTHQREFFLKGCNFLKPLTMKMVADSVGVHESTVSRTVNGKYIQTPMGVYELRFFFSSALDESLSSSGVKNMIKRIIIAENKSRPLSDEQIRRLLEEKGIKIARRTVSKYREELSILPAQKRNRYPSF